MEVKSILMIIIAYIWGSINVSLILGKLFYKVNVEEHGSGNLGATNVSRVLGKKVGLLVALYDVFIKGALIVYLAKYLNTDISPYIVGFFAVIGHIYPIFNKFKGGKGVATSQGVIIAYNPVAALIGLITFLTFGFMTRIVSLTSIITAFVTILYILVKGSLSNSEIVFLVLHFILITYAHRQNIKRIQNREERRFGKKL